MADVTLSSVKRRIRRRSVVLTSSNSAVAIPEWVRDGKGILYVSGCGGGGGGRSWPNSGGSGAWALKHPFLMLGVTQTSLNVVIGAGGAAGVAGGDTTLTVGGVQWLLLGGGGPGGSFTGQGGAGGDVFLFGTAIKQQSLNSSSDTATARTIAFAVAVAQDVRPLGTLSRGTQGVSSSVDAGVAQESAVIPAATASRTPTPFGGSTTTHRNFGVGGAVGQAGGPGLMILEFEELPND